MGPGRIDGGRDRPASRPDSRGARGRDGGPRGRAPLSSSPRGRTGQPRPSPARAPPSTPGGSPILGGRGREGGLARRTSATFLLPHAPTPDRKATQGLGLYKRTRRDLLKKLGTGAGSVGRSERDALKSTLNLLDFFPYPFGSSGNE